MFIGRFGSRHIPMSQIKLVTAAPDDANGQRRLRLDLMDGESAHVLAAQFDTAMENFAQASFPADGAMLVDLWYDEDDRPCQTELRTVIGFYVDGWGDTRTLTLDGTAQDPVLLTKSGRVEAFEKSWDSLDTYLEEKQQEHDDRLAAKRAATTAG